MTSVPLWQLQEFSDIYADALCRDDAGQVMFMSCYGRDTAIQQLMAAFQLPTGNGGIDTFRLAPAIPMDGIKPGQSTTAFVGDPRRLTKLTGKLPRRNLFGNLAHVFIFDENIVQANRGSGTGWVLTAAAEAELHRHRVWQMVRQLSTVPLLEHWREALLLEVGAEVVTDFDGQSRWPTLGHLCASRIVIDQDRFISTVSRLVRARVLLRYPDCQAVAA